MDLQESINYFTTNYGLVFDTTNNYTIKQFVIQVLQTTRSLNRPSLSLDIAREKIKRRIDDINTSFVVGDSYDGVGGGHNTGLIQNTVEIKHLKKLELEEKLQLLIKESIELEANLDTINEYARCIISTLTSEDLRDTIEVYYIHCKSLEYICQNTGYDYNTINVRKHRAINQIANKIEKIIKCNWM